MDDRTKRLLDACRRAGYSRVTIGDEEVTVESLAGSRKEKRPRVRGHWADTEPLADDGKPRIWGIIREMGFPTAAIGHVVLNSCDKLPRIFEPGDYDLAAERAA